MSSVIVRRVFGVAIGLATAVVALEVGVRIWNHQLFRVESYTTDRRDGPARFIYHQTLGWVPAPGRTGEDPAYDVDAASLRTGRPGPFDGPPILAVGDSFTFGDDVNNGDTWPIHLESLLNRRVLNAGVSAYGLDQAVLRAESLLNEHRPSVVILAFISDDVSRTEYNHYAYGAGWKPYFELVDGGLGLKNTPVPTERAAPRFRGLRHVLGYSALADVVFRSTLSRWWRGFAATSRVHQDGERVSVELLARLNQRVTAIGARFVAVALATDGGIGGNGHLVPVIARARGRGIDVLDLSPEVLTVDPAERPRLFTQAHYSPEMNARIAARIAAHLHQAR